MTDDELAELEWATNDPDASFEVLMAYADELERRSRLRNPIVSKSTVTKSYGGCPPEAAKKVRDWAKREVQQPTAKPVESDEAFRARTDNNVVTWSILDDVVKDISADRDALVVEIQQAIDGLVKQHADLRAEVRREVERLREVRNEVNAVLEFVGKKSNVVKIA